MSTLTRFAIVTAMIAVVTLAIAGIIGVSTGAFRAMATGAFRFNEAGRASGVAVDERKSLPIAGINHITVKSVSENITIREGSGESVTAWLHGNVSPTSPDDRPHLQVNQRGDTAEIRIERHQLHQHVAFRVMYFGGMHNDAVLEVGIPKQYAGKLTAEGVSSDITLASHHYTEVVLTTISGDIETDAVKAGNLTLHTISGDVNAHSTSDRIAVETVSGDIRLGMPPNTEFALDAHSTSGDVTCDFPITLTSSHADGGEHSLVGTVRSGKGAITARTVSGDIGITRS